MCDMLCNLEFYSEVWKGQKAHVVSGGVLCTFQKSVCTKREAILLPWWSYIAQLHISQAYRNSEWGRDKHARLSLYASICMPKFYQHESKRYLTGLLLASVGALSRSRWARSSLLGKVLFWVLTHYGSFLVLRTGLSQTFPGIYIWVGAGFPSKLLHIQTFVS